MPSCVNVRNFYILFFLELKAWFCFAFFFFQFCDNCADNQGIVFSLLQTHENFITPVAKTSIPLTTTLLLFCCTL